MTDDQLLRYSRHILLDALGIEGQTRILATNALIIGAGGLGSPAALYLASAGIGRITLVDDDTVDFTNLQRQILHTQTRVGMAKVESGRQALAEVNPETVIPFGSQAKGTAGPDSDVDLLVIEREPFSPERSRWRESTRLQMALRGFDISTDILLYSQEEFDSWRNSINHVIGRASREGRFLYERH